MTERDCPQCGETVPASEFTEGYCRPCATDNQAALDQHNADYDRWRSMTRIERNHAIMKASRSVS